MKDEEQPIIVVSRDYPRYEVMIDVTDKITSVVSSGIGVVITTSKGEIVLNTNTKGKTK